VADKYPADQWLDFDMTNIDWIGGDHYQWPNDTAAFNLGYLIDAAKARGKRVLVAETGALPLSKATDQARADWYAGIAALVDANPGLFVGVLTFESDRGPENPPCCLLAYTGAWDSYSPKAATLYRALCTA
jgi:non-ribosomal peptide synthetase component F